MQEKDKVGAFHAISKMTLSVHTKVRKLRFRQLVLGVRLYAMTFAASAVSILIGELTLYVSQVSIYFLRLGMICLSLCAFGTVWSLIKLDLKGALTKSAILAAFGFTVFPLQKNPSLWVERAGFAMYAAVNNAVEKNCTLSRFADNEGASQRIGVCMKESWLGDGITVFIIFDTSKESNRWYLDRSRTWAEALDSQSETKGFPLVNIGVRELYGNYFAFFVSYTEAEQILDARTHH